jgi:7-keto-8-aminopelargonate synthetase-like enzyme
MPLGPELRFFDRTKVEHRGKTYVFFGGTDYHRLGSHPEVLAIVREAAESQGMDCAGSRVTTGNHPALLALEAKVGEFLGGRETALCSGGYLSNTVALEAVAEDYQHFFLDASAHASVATPAEGMPRKALHRFRAQDPEDLARQLKRHLRPGEKPLVLTDGVVSGYGQVPPLKAYWEAVRDLGGRLLVDDSHGVAVLGATGKGSPEEAGLPPQAFLQTGTLSKGFGLFGGFVAGDPGMMEKVAGRSRAFVGATPIPPFLAAAAVRAIGIVQEHPELIATLQARAVAMSRRLSALGFPVSGTRAPIFSVTYRDEARNRRLGEILERYGIYPTFINYPGCPPGGHFRFALSSVHTDEEVERLLQAIADSRGEQP